jgi:hypothetical protein
VLSDVAHHALKKQVEVLCHFGRGLARPRMHGLSSALRLLK